MKVLREGPVKITKTTVDAAWRRRSGGVRLMVTDEACRGLALVVNPTGMTWRFDFKPRGTDSVTGKRFASQSVTIGNPETHSPDAAREAANAAKGQAKAGTDPARERRAKIAAAAERRATTCDRLMEDYAKALSGRPKLRGTGRLSAVHVMAETRHAKAALLEMKAGSKPVQDISAADLRVLIRATADQPGAARHRFGALSRFLDWCQDEGLITVNPCAAVAKARRPKAVEERAEFLTPKQLGILWKAAGETSDLEPVHRDYLRFLIATPCRRTEAATLDWSHLDLEAAVWSQPRALTKNGDPHRVHLHPLALALLRERHEAAGKPKTGLVFPAPRSTKAITTFSAMKTALDKASGLTDWRLHDVRRSFATALGEAGISEPVVDAVLNHRQSATRSGVLGVYQRATRWPEQKAAMIRWGDLLEAAIAGKGEVIRLFATAH